MASQATTEQATFKKGESIKRLIGNEGGFTPNPRLINGVKRLELSKQLSKTGLLLREYLMDVLLTREKSFSRFFVEDLASILNKDVSTIRPELKKLSDLGFILVHENKKNFTGKLIFWNNSENKEIFLQLEKDQIKPVILETIKFENSDNIVSIFRDSRGKNLHQFEGKISEVEGKTFIPSEGFSVNHGEKPSLVEGKTLTTPKAKTLAITKESNAFLESLDLYLLDHYLDHPPSPLTPQGDLEPTPELMKKVKAEIGHEPKRTMDDFKKINWGLGECPPSDLDLNINNKSSGNIPEEKEQEKPKPLYQTLTPNEISDLFSDEPLPGKLSDIPDLPNPEPREPVNMTRVISAKDQGVEPGLSKEFINKVLGTDLKVVDSLPPADTKEVVNERLSEKKEHIGYDKLNDLLELVKPVSNYFNINFFKQVTDRFGYHATIKATEGFVSVMEEDPSQVKAHQKYLLSLLEQKAEDFKPVITSVKPVIKADGMEGVRKWVRDRVKCGFAESQVDETILDFTIKPYFSTLYRGNPASIYFNRDLLEVKKLVEFTDFARFLNRFQVFSAGWPHVSASVIASFLEHFEGLEG